MKKFISILLLTISMFSFFILYNEQQQVQTYNMKNAEHQLNNSYRIIIPSKINSLPKGRQYQEILKASNSEDVSIYFTRVDETNGKEKIIKYIYTTNNDYMNKFQLIWGKKIDKTKMDTHYFLSTENTGNKDQIGQIASFNGVSMEIHTLQSMVDDKLLLDGPCTVTLPSGKSINSYKDILGNGLGIKDLEISQQVDKLDINKNGYLEISILFFVIMLLVLYDILKSYKKISIKKLLGFSTLDIWKDKICQIIIIEMVTMTISTVIMSLILFRTYNIYYFYFLKDLVIRYAFLLIVTFVVASLPFIYVNNMDISSCIKNKYPAKDILFFNIVIKVILCTLLIFIVNKQVINYNNIKKVFDNSYKNWEDVSNYRVLSLDNLSSEAQYSNADIEIYKYFNKRGAIFAGFGMYESESIKLNKNIDKTQFFATVNPNYLNKNSVYNINGKKVTITESNSNFVLLVPVKYKSKENKIRQFYQKWIDSYKINRKVQIIWTMSNQKLFSYDFMVNSSDNYCVTDPILFVGTENGGYPGWNTQLFNVQGNPFKVKVNSSKSDKEFIEKGLQKYGYLSYGLQINRANEEVISNVKEYKDLFWWSTMGIIIILFILSIIFVQNIYNFYEQFKVQLAVRQLHGYKKIDKYKEYLFVIILSWIIVGAVCYFSSLALLKVITIVSVIGFLIELILSFIMLTYVENKRITDFIKGGA